MVDAATWPVALQSADGTRSAAMLWRTHGQLRVTVIVKATFALEHGAEMTLVAPDPIVRSDEHEANDPARGLVASSELAPFLPRADVLFRGHAYPADRAAATAAVRIALFGVRPLLDKTVHVYGDRTAPLASEPQGPPAMFERMPIVYERAFRGTGFDENTAGIAPVPGGPLPNLFDPTDPEGPAGFGPIAPRWPQRRRLLRQIDPATIYGRIAEIPDAFAWSFFQAAPPDQRCAFLRGDEWLVLDGLHPSLPRIESRLPEVRAAARVLGAAAGDGAMLELELSADTLEIDGDRQTCSLLWRGNFPVANEDALASVRVSFAVELGGKPFAWQDPLAQTAEYDDDPPTMIQSRPPDGPAPARPPRAERPAPPPPIADPEMTMVAQSPLLAALAARSAAACEVDDPPTVDRMTTEPRPARGRREARVSPGTAAAAVAPLFDIEDHPTVAAEGDALQALIAATLDARDRDLPGARARGARPELRREVIERLARGEVLDGMDLSGVDLSELNLEGRSLVAVNLKRASLRGARLGGAALKGSDLGGADLTFAVLDGADLEGVDLYAAIVGEASFRRAKLTDANLSTARGDRAIFEEATGQRALFAGGRFAGARFDRARLPGADFTEAVLDGARFPGADLTDVRLYEARAIRAHFDEATMSGARADSANLEGASLARVFAPDSVWDQAALDDASFRGAMLPGASFVKASCRRVDFSEAELAEARLKRARLEGAQFVKTDVSMATFEGADLRGTDVEGTLMARASAPSPPPEP